MVIRRVSQGQEIFDIKLKTVNWRVNKEIKSWNIRLSPDFSFLYLFSKLCSMSLFILHIAEFIGWEHWKHHPLFDSYVSRFTRIIIRNRHGGWAYNRFLVWAAESPLTKSAFLPCNSSNYSSSFCLHIYLILYMSEINSEQNYPDDTLYLIMVLAHHNLLHVWKIFHTH